MRICTLCKVEKPLEDFSKEKTCAEGRRHQCKECRKDRCKAWRAANSDRAKQYHRDKYQERASYIKAWNKRDNEANPEKASQRYKTYKDVNRPKIYANNAKRRADRVRATPSWANLKYIELFYKLAKEEAFRTGREVQVDHIVPLNSPIVCGLHCEDNLQLLFKEDNIRKGNKYVQ
jgi:hypothetical protein